MFPNDSRGRIVVFISSWEQRYDFVDVCEFEDEIAWEGIEVIKYNLGARMHKNTYDCSTQNDEDGQFYITPIVFDDLIDTIPTPNVPTHAPSRSPTTSPQMHKHHDQFEKLVQICKIIVTFY